jgi:tetratricopeptide (TPR) repeat protein
MQAEKSCLEAWAAYIRVLLLRGELNEAHVWITRAIGIFPDAPAILSLRAVKHARSGMMTQAIALSDSLLAQNSEELEPWISRGHILTIDGNRNAEFCFQQALHFSSDLDWQVPFMIALILDGERKWSKSIAYYHKALERRSTLPYAWLRMGMAHAKLGQKEASRRDYVRALDLCEDDDRLRRKIEGLSTGSGFSRLLRPFEFLRKRKKAKPPVEDDELDA